MGGFFSIKLTKRAQKTRGLYICGFDITYAEFITLSNLTETLQNFVQGSFSINLTKTCRKDRGVVLQIYSKQTPTQVLSCKFFKTFKNSFFYRLPLVAVSIHKQSQSEREFFCLKPSKRQFVCLHRPIKADVIFHRF